MNATNQQDERDSWLNQARGLLKSVFGYDEFRSRQAEIIADVCAGQDCFVLMPTGGGKSLCYQIPALMREGTAVVVSPLIALMQDQVSALHNNGVAAAMLNSSQSQAESDEVMQQLFSGGLDLLYVSPERLQLPGFVQALQRIPLALFAIDEAHCVSQWGHQFRPEYRRLGALRQVFAQVPFMALTATADLTTRDDIVQQLNLQQARIHLGGFDRPNIFYRVEDKQSAFKQLVAFLQQRPQESGIIYALSRKRVESLAQKLLDAGFSARAYHAGMANAERRQVQQEFIRDQLSIVVATVAFGMGIDKPNVRFVVHYDMPKNIEGYYQETGRAGRDGLPAEALMLFSMQDVAAARQFVEQVEDDEQRRLESYKLNSMVSLAAAQQCRRNVLLDYFGEPQSQPCGHCDICLNPPEMFDATVEAQKLLSCIYRLNQSFGAKHVIDVLRGLDNERIRQQGHKALSTYGIGKEHGAQQWQSILRQLMHLGYVYQDVHHYSVLRLTEQAAALLKGQERVELARLKAVASSTRASGGAKHSRLQALNDAQQHLFERLRDLRRALAEEQGVPAYVVFGDLSLLDMAEKQPTTEDEFLAISGVGQAKLERYGQTFIQHIREITSA